MTPTKPPAKAAQMIDNPPLVPGQRGWKLHRCPDGQQCRGDIGGGCARGWCEHFGIKPEDAAPPLQDAGVLREALEAAETDATRYRWLRDSLPWTLISCNGMTQLAVQLPVQIAEHADDANELYAAIDAAIAAQKGGGT